jgi:opacity protein-like surface antigen
MRRAARVLVFAAAVGAAIPATASAEGFVAPWAGVNFANDDIDRGRGSFGVSAGAMGGGIIGGEFDFGYSPSFWGDEQVLGSNNIMSAMGNLIVGIPIGGQTGGGVRPYVTGGLGIIRTDIEGLFDDDISGTSNTDFAFNLGGGVMGFFNDHFGLRGELRYLRTLNSDLGDSDLDPELGLGDFDFWRMSFGVVIR